MQESIVILISIFAFAIAVWRTYKVFTDFDSFNVKKEPDNKQGNKILKL